MNISKVLISFLFVLLIVAGGLFVQGQPRVGALTGRGWVLVALGSLGGFAFVLIARRLTNRQSLRSTAARDVATRQEATRDQNDLAREMPAEIASVLSEGPSYPHPVINVQTCIGCRACVEACPHDVLAMVNGKATTIATEQCMEDTSCQVECPTVPKSCIVVNATKKIPQRKVPARDGKYLTNVPGIYLIGDVSGVPLIKNAINEGGNVIDFVTRDLAETRAEGTFDFDVAIIGMGPAGLSAALIANQRKLRYVAIEQDEILATIQQSYQAGKYIYFNPVDQPARGGIDLEGPGAVKEDIVTKWLSAVATSGVSIKSSERCIDIRRSADHLTVIAVREADHRRSEYRCASVILAIGNRGMPMKLGVPGEDLKIRLESNGGAEDDKVRYRLTDPAAYRGKHIVVVGAGNSAIETAIDLAAIRSKSGGEITGWRDNIVSLVIRSDFKGDLKLGNKMMVYDCIDSGRIKAFFGKTIKEIKPDEITLCRARDTSTVTDTMKCDYIFCLIGGEKPTRFLESIGIQVG